MSVHVHGGTVTGGVTPICDDCGVSLCWDISRTEYLEAKAFWDAWTCQDCNGSRLSAHGWRHENGREALPAAVEAVIVAYAEANPSLESAFHCHHRSREASDGFAAALAAAGFGATVEAIAEAEGKPHYAVRLGAFTIDWTAVQHDFDAPTPLVYRSSLGWPIDPSVSDGSADSFDGLTPEQLERLRAILIERAK